MNRFLICLAFAICANALYAQNNVGINTTNPQASLDIRGSQRIGGNSNYIHFDSATGRIQWVGAGLFVPSYQHIIRHSATAEGLYAGGDRLEYRNNAGPVFYTDWTNGNGYFSNNLGIRNASPLFPLSFNGALGDKLSLWTDGTSTHYGFGIQAGLLQMFTKTSDDDIAFGFGSSTAFTERMRIKGNGNVGIGTSNPRTRLHIISGNSGGFAFAPSQLAVETNSHTYINLLSPDAYETSILFGKASDALSGGIMYNSAGTLNGFQFRTNGNQTRMVIDDAGEVGIGTTNPQFPLDVGGRMRLRSNGPSFGSAGIWFDNTSNNTAAFVGMEDDTHVGFYGSNGAGWKFSMNTQTGALKVNGIEGAAGQVLQSNGSAASPSWISGTNALYNNTVAVVNSDYTTTSSNISLPGMTYTFTVAGNAKVLVNYVIPFTSAGCGGCANTNIYIDILLNGSVADRTINTLPSTGYVSISGNRLLSVAAGTHTVRLFLALVGSAVNINPCCGFSSEMILQIIPQ